MQKRNPAAVFIFSLITFGIYGLVWDVKTKNEMNKLGNSIPTAWLLIIPFVNYYWYWKYSEGVDNVTRGKISAVLAFILLILLGVIGMAIIQNEFNKVSGGFEAGAAAPVSTPGPVSSQPPSFVQPVAPTSQPPATQVQPQVFTPAPPTDSQQPPVPPVAPQSPPQV